MPFKRILPQTFYEIFLPELDYIKDVAYQDHVDDRQFYIDEGSATGLSLDRNKMGGSEIFQISLYPLKIKIISRRQQAIINNVTVEVNLELLWDEFKKEEALKELARQYSVKLSRFHEDVFFLDENTPQFTIMAKGHGIFSGTDDETVFIKAIKIFEKDGLISRELAQHLLDGTKCNLSDQSTVELVKTFLIDPEKNKEILKFIFFYYFPLTIFNEENKQQELIKLYEHPWVKNNLVSMVGRDRYLANLSKLNKQESFELTRENIFFPWEQKESLLFFNQLIGIEIFDGGFSKDNWSWLSQKILSQVNVESFYKKREAVVQHFINDWSKKSSRIKEKNIENFLSQGWSFLRFQGRTILLTKKNLGTVLALKVQKQGEKPIELHKQHKTVRFLNANKKLLNLKSQFPKPLCLSKIAGLSEWLAQLQIESVITQEQLDHFLKNIEMREEGGVTAYVYEANLGYFNYLHDPSFSDKEFYEAAFNALNDLLSLLEQGIVYDRLSDLFHNQERGSEEREDSGRYLTLVNLLRKGASGGGRLNAFEKAIEFINIGKDGLRDEGDWRPLECFTQPTEVFAKKFFSEAHAIHDDKAKLYITANFIAEYFLVLELAAGKRILNQIREQPNLTPVEKTTLWKNATAILHELYIDGFVKFTALPKDVVRRFFNEACHLEAYAKEMAYWMVPMNYIGDIKKNRVDPGIYDEHTAVTVDFEYIRKGTFNDTVGCSIDGENPDLGTVNGQYPIKTGECARYHLVTYGFVAREMKGDSRKLREFARLKYENGDLQEAKTYYQKAITSDPFDRLSRKMLVKVCQDISKKTNHSIDVLDEKKYTKETSAALIQRFWRTRAEKNHGIMARQSDDCKQFKKSR